MPTVVAGNSDGADILLYGRSNDVAGGSVEPQIDNLQPFANEFEIDGIDRTVVPVADRDSSEKPDGNVAGTPVPALSYGGCLTF